MADSLTITRFGATEPASCTHSMTSARFSRFLGALAVAIESERAFETAHWSALARDGWLAETERNWETATTLASAVSEVSPTLPGDVPLQRMAEHLNWTLGCETFAELGTARRVLADHPELFSWAGTDQASRRAARMLDEAHRLFGQVCALEMLESLSREDPAPPAWAAQGPAQNLAQNLPLTPAA